MLRLKEARKKKGLTQVEVAQAIGISQNGYSDWERGRNRVDHDSLTKLAELYGVSADYLIGKDSAPNPAFIRIPVLGNVPAGIPLEAIEDIVDWEDLPADMTSGGKEYFGLKVKGDSMYPEYLDGDTVIVRKTPSCNSGDVCVVFVNGYDATLKQVKFGDNGTLTIIPRNPEYAPRTFSKKEIRDLPVSISGVVVELRRRVN
jgi:repressor LexA